MKNYNSQSYICLLLLTLGILGCKENATNASNNSNDSTEISFATAKSKINQYIQIYGETGNQYLEGSNGDSVILPRFFIVNSFLYRQLLEDRDNILYASLNVKMQDDKPISNLIFHDQQPLPDGSVNELDLFHDFVSTCPTDCSDLKSNNVVSGGPIDHTEAKRRIEAYNHIYDSGPQNVRYMKNANNTDSVLIPRYYSFNVSDMEGVLDSLHTNDEQFFYVSMGADTLFEAGVGQPNTYVSDLVFHYDRPYPNGRLHNKDGNTDAFYDVTRPCPNSCDTTVVTTQLK